MAGEKTTSKDGGGVPSDASKKTKGRSSRSKTEQNNVSKMDSCFATNFQIPNQDEEEGWTCKGCNVVFTDDNDKVLECERCRSHHCTRCLGKTDKEYEMLQKSDSMWFCTGCKEIVQKHIVTDLKIEERCRAILNECESRIAALEAALTQKCDKEMVRKIIKEDQPQTKHTEETRGTTTTSQKPILTNIMSEINERKNRESNIVIYGIPEASSTLKDTRIAHDTSHVNNILDKCRAKSGEDIEKVIRLGKYNKEEQDGKQRHRPLLVCFKNIETKKTLFKNIRTLGEHEELKHIKISNDLTKAEREQEKELWEEAKKKREENPSGEFTYKIRGPPWDRKIVKIKVATSSD